MTVLRVCSVQWSVESKKNMAWRNKACWGFGGGLWKGLPCRDLDSKAITKNIEGHFSKCHSIIDGQDDEM